MLPKRVDSAPMSSGARRASPLPGVARAGLTRRGFIGRAAGAAGALVGASVLRPGTALAAKPTHATPNPIPGGLTINGVTFHVLPFGPGQEPSTITDFNGFVGVAQVQGTGTQTNPDGTSETLLYDTDMRFMKGVYVGKDGRIHRWSGPVTDRSHVNDPDVGFAGKFILSHATMTWSARGADGVSFVADPGGTTSVFAQLGHMRNGVFFD